MTPQERRSNPRLQIEKDVVKEAVEEWLDMQFMRFGKWSFAGICCAVFAWGFYAWLSAQGFHK